MVMGERDSCVDQIVEEVFFLLPGDEVCQVILSANADQIRFYALLASINS